MSITQDEEGGYTFTVTRGKFTNNELNSYVFLFSQLRDSPKEIHKLLNNRPGVQRRLYNFICIPENSFEISALATCFYDFKDFCVQNAVTLRHVNNS